MNAAASTVLSEGYLKGFFDVVGAMLSQSATFEAQDPQEAPADALGDMASRYSVVIQAKIKEGGGVAFLFQLDGVRKITSAVMGEEPPADEAISDEEGATLKEVFDPCVGGGPGHFKEAYEKIVDLEPSEVSVCGPDTAQALVDLLGRDVVATPFTYSVPPDMDGDGIILYSESLEQIVPADKLGGDAAGGGLSQDEVGDILGDFGQQPVAAAGAPGAAEAPENLEMILDIGLVVTARMGRVEMPVGDILSLGPGSIIEVGRMVDEPVELLVNDKLIARGDVVVVDEKFGLRITEIVSPQERIESLR